MRLSDTRRREARNHEHSETLAAGCYPTRRHSTRQIRRLCLRRSLGEVLAGRGAIDYRDAKTFFSKTYLTQGLTQLLIDVMRRLGGSGKGEPVIQLQTAFGGGKTHTLLTQYHLFKKPNVVGKLLKSNRFSPRQA